MVQELGPRRSWWGSRRSFLNEHKRGKWAGKRSLQLVGCVEVSDFLDMLIAVGWERSVYYCLLSWLQSKEAPAWDYIDLCNLPEESLSYRVLPSIFKRAGLRVEVNQEDVAPHVHLRRATRATWGRSTRSSGMRSGVNSGGRSGSLRSISSWCSRWTSCRSRWMRFCGCSV